MDKTTRCTRCHAEFADDEIENAVGCPACGCSGVPMWIKNDIQLPINWHELRILSFWASNWAEKYCDDEARIDLHAILKRLDKYRPENCGPLTLVAEIKELQKDFPQATLYGDNGDVIVPPVED